MNYGPIISGRTFDKLREENKISPETALSFGVKDPGGKTYTEFTQNGAGQGYSAVGGKPILPKVGEVARGDAGYFRDPTKTGIPFKNNFGAGNVEVRAGMNAIGIPNGQIGWDGKNVTANGQIFLTPTVNDNGVTKTDARTFIDSANKYYKNNGMDDELQSVNMAASSLAGISKAVQYNDNGVSIGGVPIQNVVIMNGVAYAPKSSIMAAVEGFKKQNNVRSAMETYDSYMNRNGENISDIEKALNNYEPFSYNADEDPAYQEYKRQYMKNAQEAYDDTWGRQAGRTGGYANSAAMALSDKAYYDHMSQLDNVIPTLMDKAYTRYKDDYSRLQDRMDMYGNPLTRYEMESGASNTDYNRVQEAITGAYDRNADERNFEYQKSLDEWNQSLDKWNQDFQLSAYKDEQEKYWYENAYYKLPAEQRTQQAWEVEFENMLLELQLAKDTYDAKVAMAKLGVLFQQAQIDGLNIQNAMAMTNAEVENNLKIAQTNAANASAAKYNADAAKTAKETEKIGDNKSALESIILGGKDDGGGNSDGNVSNALALGKGPTAPEKGSDPSQMSWGKGKNEFGWVSNNNNNNKKDDYEFSDRN